MKQLSSVISGTPSLAKTQQKPTGTPHGEIGSDALVTTSGKSQPAAIRDSNPGANLEAALSQLSDYGLSLKIGVTGSRFPQDGGWEPIQEVRGKVAANCDWDGVSKVLSRLMAPASPEAVMEWLAVLAVETASRNEDEGTGQLRFTTLAERLSAYPGDIVRHSLRAWPETHRFFPTSWRELKSDLDSRIRQRRMIAVAAQRIASSSAA